MKASTILAPTDTNPQKTPKRPAPTVHTNRQPPKGSGPGGLADRSARKRAAERRVSKAPAVICPRRSDSLTTSDANSKGRGARGSLLENALGLLKGVYFERPIPSKRPYVLKMTTSPRRPGALRFLLHRCLDAPRTCSMDFRRSPGRGGRRRGREVLRQDIRGLRQALFWGVPRRQSSKRASGKRFFNLRQGEGLLEPSLLSARLSPEPAP